MKTLVLLIGTILILCITNATAQKVSLQIRKQIGNFVAAGSLTQKEVKECGGASKIVDVTSVDLNKDGKPEYIVGLTCILVAIYVLRKTANGFEIIYEGGEREFITPMKSYTKGWRNLRSLSYSAGSGGQSSEILRWNGTEYK